MSFFFGGLQKVGVHGVGMAGVDWLVEAEVGSVSGSVMVAECAEMRFSPLTPFLQWFA